MLEKHNESVRAAYDVGNTALQPQSFDPKQIADPSFYGDGAHLSTTL